MPVINEPKYLHKMSKESLSDRLPGLSRNVTSLFSRKLTRCNYPQVKYSDESKSSTLEFKPESQKYKSKSRKHEPEFDFSTLLDSGATYQWCYGYFQIKPL